MVTTWSDIRLEFGAAARLLRDGGLHRSSLGRAYYAVFAEVSRALLVARVTMPHGWEGPAHGRIVDLIASHLSRWLTAPEVGRLVFLVTELYRLRLISDYSPTQSVEPFDNNVGLAYMAQSLALLERVQ